MRFFFTTLILCSLLGINTLQAQIPTAGLQAYWSFDGNANDLSGNGNNGIVNGATLTLDRFGNANRAYFFDGINDKIDVLNSSTVDIPDNHDFSFAFWIKTNPGNTNACPISKSIWGSWNGYLFYTDISNLGYCNSPGQLSFYVASNAQQDACADSAICDNYNDWYFITGVYDAASNESYLYVNSVLQFDIGTKFASTSNTMNLTFGAHNSGNMYFNGSLDGVRLYNVVLDQNGIDALFNEVNPAAGIKEYNIETIFCSVYPNPSSQTLIVDINNSFIQKLEDEIILTVYSIEGKLVKSDKLMKNELQMNNKLNIESLSKGLYFIKLRSGNYNQNLKFIKE
ncbi:MAG: T9SS type A sorting domain-containing protein [Bacteroidetes bacterium]|nr:T9SS type A sorting domain-containing protein [Bacteroidota bacterium]